MDYYELLGIDRSASTDDVRDAYLRLVKRVHPDSGGSAALFRQVEEAYRVLSNPTERKRYDRDATTNSGARQRPRTTVPTPQAVVEEVLLESARWVKDVTQKRSARRDEKLHQLQAAWPKTLGLEFLRVDLQAWRPFLMSAVPGRTRCSASWARHELVEAPMPLRALRVDVGPTPRLLIWRVEGTTDDWVSWRAASADGNEIELRMHIDASPGCRPKWARRKLPPGTHLIVDSWTE